MEEKLIDILWEVKEGKKHPNRAYKELCTLFSVSCRIPKPHGRRIEYADYYIKKYSPQFGLDKEKLKEFMTNFLGDEWMSDPNKSYS